MVDQSASTPTRPSLAVFPGTTPDDQVNAEELEVCKHGSSATFSYSVTDLTTQAVNTGSFSLNDGQCIVVAAFGGKGANFTVSETGAQSGFGFDHAVVTTATAPATCSPLTTSSSSQTTTDVTGFISGSSAPDGLCHGTLIDYYNIAAPPPPPPPPPSGTGRMTGGGQQTDVAGVDISRGFTIHCDIILSNNLEFNWKGNKWHIDKPLTSAQCIDDPNIDQKPPKAPLDTFIGEGIGQLNGVDGSLVKFTFIDAGEPGSNDMAKIQIFAPGGALVLDVPLSYLTHGNIQAHFDQPHK
jgi:hypothetical protein